MRRSLLIFAIVTASVLGFVLSKELRALIEPRAIAANNYTVINTDDSGPGSLRQAITDANTNPGADTISFNIPGGGVHTISPTSSLPVITDPVVIDGYTQPGSSPNNIADGDNAVLLIELSGIAIPGGPLLHSGLLISASNCTVRGLVINRFDGHGIMISASSGTVTGNLVEGNFIGTDPTGTIARSNVDGVAITFSNTNTIGGTTPAARNVISGNNGRGISVTTQASATTIQGNFIGTSANGKVALGNGTGGILSGGTAPDTIGGTAAGAGNVISGNLNNAGIFIQSGSGTGPTIQGNLIGTDVTGTVALGNVFGIWLNFGPSLGNSNIGGTVAGSRNVISGNRSDGILISGSSRNNQVVGNFIGTDISGTKPLGNVGNGIQIEAQATANRIGGTAPGQGNTIAFNQRNGLLVAVGATNANAFRRNSIYSNGLLGIDLGGDGVTANDPGDTDPGPNNTQNFPVITSVTTNATQTMVAGTLNSTPSTTFSLNLYTNASCDPSGNGEGAVPFGPGAFGIGTDAGGNVTFNVTVPAVLPAGQVITATVTDPAGNTSEFSACDATNAAGGVQLSDETAKVIEDVGFLPITVFRLGGSSGTLTVNYSTRDITATAGSDYSTTSGTLTFDNGELFKTVNVPILDDAITETDETFAFTLSNPSNIDSLRTPSEMIITVQDHSTVPTLTVNSLGVAENAGKGQTAVHLSAATGRTVTVDYATSDLAGTQNCNVVNGRASSRCDYISALGTLTFAPRETEKLLTILMIDDSYNEGNENLTMNLSNPTNAIISFNAVNILIFDSADSNGPNPIDQSPFYVREHYLDFLNREPDASGLAFWIGDIDNCTPKPDCTDVHRVNVSAAFFLSIEFQQTGYLVERLYKTAYADASGTSNVGGAHQIPVPVVRLNEFLADTQKIGKGVIVGNPGWPDLIENNTAAFVAEFVQRPRFTTAFPLSMTPAQFVDGLNANAGNPLSTAERNQLVADLTGGTRTRAQVLRAVAEDQDLQTAEFNRAFVLMQFFGYLRRNPNDPQDSDYSGYDFWLSKLNQFNGNFANAEMVKAFITSTEYRQRFGP